MTSSEDLIRQAKAGLGAASDGTPRRRQMAVTCMDARVDPWRILRATAGDMHVVRNAGGVVTDDVVRSATVSAIVFGTTDLRLIMHTDCGMHGLDEGTVRDRCLEMTGTAPPMPLLGFDDLEAELARGVERLRSEPTLATVERVTGSVYDVRTGRLHTVVA